MIVILNENLIGHLKAFAKETFDNLYTTEHDEDTLFAKGQVLDHFMKALEQAFEGVVLPMAPPAPAGTTYCAVISANTGKRRIEYSTTVPNDSIGTIWSPLTEQEAAIAESIGLLRLTREFYKAHPIEAPSEAQAGRDAKGEADERTEGA